MSTQIQPEEWRPVQGWPRYLVSSEGRILSRCRRNDRVLSPAVHDNGYLRVNLVESSGRRRARYVHTLVALAFDGPRPTVDHEVRHLNGNPLDNRAANLRWGTRSQNMRDQIRHGTHGQAFKTHCPQGHPYDDENTKVIPSRPTARYCRACQRQHGLNYARRRALRAASVPSERAA